MTAGDTTSPRNRAQQAPVTFRGEELERELAARRSRWAATPGQVAKRDLTRYYDLIGREAVSLRFTEAELLAVCDALNGTVLDERVAQLLWAEVSDAFEAGNLARKWDVNGAHLVERLRRLTPGQTWALIDGVERFWAQAGVSAGAGEAPDDYPAQLRRAGFAV